MKHEGPELDNGYTPENVSGVRTSGIGYLIAVIIAFVAVAVCFVLMAKKDDDHIVIDRETVSISERPPLQQSGYVTKTGIVRDLDLDTSRFKAGSTIYLYDDGWFTEGDILTSIESGTLILWDTTMPESWIIGVVSDSGLIDFKPFRIEPK